jgi:large subunit ribosomal protein L24
MHVRKGDTVVVIAGKDKGKRGRVQRMLADKGRAVVERVNMMKRHTKPTQANPRGGILDKEGSIALSNLALWCGKCGAGRRAKAELREGQKKRRVCVKCGSLFESA